MPGPTRQFVACETLICGTTGVFVNSGVGDKVAVGIVVLAILLALLAVVTAPRSLLASCITILGTISLMGVLRHLVRVAHLRPYFDPRSLPVQGQWVVFCIFVVLLLAGLGTVGWMLSAFFRSAPDRAGSS